MVMMDENDDVSEVGTSECASTTQIRFLTESGNELNEAPIIVPCSASVRQLEVLCNKFLRAEEDAPDEDVPIVFRTDDGVEIVDSLEASLDKKRLAGEKVETFRRLQNCFYWKLKVGKRVIYIRLSLI